MAYGRRERLRSTFALSGTPSQQDGSIDGSSRSRTSHVRAVPGTPGPAQEQDARSRGASRSWPSRSRSSRSWPARPCSCRATRWAARPPPSPARRASESEAFQPFWDTYHAIGDRYAGGEVDRTLIVQGAIRGMIERPGRPVLGLPDLRRVPREPARDQRPVRGDRRRDRGTGAGWHRGLLAARRRLPPRRHQAARGVAGREGGRDDRRHRRLGRWHDARRPDGRCRARPDPRPEGIGRQARRPARRRRADPADDHPRHRPDARRSTARRWPAGRSATSGSSGFSDVAADEVVEALKEHLAAGRTKLILDLRGNPGGYVTAARKIASQFIASGPVFWEQDAKGDQVATDALGDGVATAADLAGRRPHRRRAAHRPARSSPGRSRTAERATLVGQQSFGKGTVQQWQELGGEGGAFKLTIARWLTPDKRWIHDVGLTPDVVVTLPDPVPAGSDPTLDRAVELLAGPRGARREPAGGRLIATGRSCTRSTHRVRFPRTKGGDVQ